MFNPTREQVRQFFTEAWQKHENKGVLTPLEHIAVDWALEHPEYHELLTDPDAVHADYRVEEGQTNPFLHLSMHLAIHEQVSIDQPPGIKAAHSKLLTQMSPHDAAHIIMEALGEIIWESQRLNKPLDNDRYIELINRYATR